MKSDDRGGHELGRRLAGLAIAVPLVAALLLWAWNGAAVQLMGAAPAGFRHAIALAAAIAGVAALTVAAARLVSGLSRRPGADRPPV
jgi:hypothetical protein